jgi:hypothetical protein
VFATVNSVIFVIMSPIFHYCCYSTSFIFRSANSAIFLHFSPIFQNCSLIFEIAESFLVTIAHESAQSFCKMTVLDRGRVGWEATHGSIADAWATRSSIAGTRDRARHVGAHGRDGSRGVMQETPGSIGLLDRLGPVMDL